MSWKNKIYLFLKNLLPLLTYWVYFPLFSQPTLSLLSDLMPGLRGFARMGAVRWSTEELSVKNECSGAHLSRSLRWIVSLLTVEDMNENQENRNIGTAEIPRNTEFFTPFFFIFSACFLALTCLHFYKLHWHFIFYMVCNGKTKQHRQFRGFLAVLVFRGAPVFLFLEHATVERFFKVCSLQILVLIFKGNP